MLKKKDIIAFRRTDSGEDIFLDYHGCENDLTPKVLEEIEQLGEWVHPACTYYGQKVIFKPNYIFSADLKFTGFTRGRSSAQACFKDSNNDKIYYMFLVDFSDIILAGCNVNKLKGNFTYTKRGCNYAIKFLGTKSV